MKTFQFQLDEEKLSLQGDAKTPVTPAFVYGLSVLAAIGGFLFGYDTGVVSGAILLIKDEFKMDSKWQELFVSATIATAAIFAVFGGLGADHFGRRPMMFVASVVFTVGAIMMGCAYERSLLLIGRLVVGIGIGIASIIVPMYIAEAAPSHMRGRLVVMNNLFITGGQFVASVLNGGFSYVHDGWRFMLGLAAIPSAIQFIGFIFMPESPRWLITHGKFEEAMVVLRRTRGCEKIAQEEFDAIKVSAEEGDRERLEKGGKFPLLTMLKMPHLRRALIVGCALQMFQQVCGINTVMYYSGTIIEMAGIKDRRMVIWYSALTASVNFLCTFIGLALVERAGRRLLVLGSLIGVFLSLILMGVSFHLMALNSPPVSYNLMTNNSCSMLSTCDACITQPQCGFCFYDDLKETNFNGSCLATKTSEDFTVSAYGPCERSLDPAESLTWAYSWCPTPYSWIPILGLALYLFCFAPGMGAMPWTLNSEIYPQWSRSTGNACATATNWVFNLIVSITFLSLLEAITKYGAYYLYAGVTLLAFVFFFLFLPETKGKTLEEVEKLFMKPWFGQGSSFQHQR